MHTSSRYVTAAVSGSPTWHMPNICRARRDIGCYRYRRDIPQPILPPRSLSLSHETSAPRFARRARFPRRSPPPPQSPSLVFPVARGAASAAAASPPRSLGRAPSPPAAAPPLRAACPRTPLPARRGAKPGARSKSSRVRGPEVACPCPNQGRREQRPSRHQPCPARVRSAQLYTARMREDA